MKFSIIVPSYNQPDFIEDTFKNLVELKESAIQKNTEIEILLFDSKSNDQTQNIITLYKHYFNYVEIKKDLGQYDAINKGIVKCTGDYWTWLNTDDLINIQGFLKLISILSTNNQIDYIYGGINYIDKSGTVTKQYNSYPINYKTLYTHTPAIFQPGSFFKKDFTNKIGLLKPYQCCFDYEYILRCFKNEACMYSCDFIVANFRFYSTSKSGANTAVFIREQLKISKIYGRKWYHFLSYFSNLRLLKHKLFPRK
jgi:glycosyltransferase involved in cell wall biosynthesis